MWTMCRSIQLTASPLPHFKARRSTPQRQASRRAANGLRYSAPPSKYVVAFELRSSKFEFILLRQTMRIRPCARRWQRRHPGSVFDAARIGCRTVHSTSVFHARRKAPAVQFSDQASVSLTCPSKKNRKWNAWPITGKRSTLQALGRNAMLTWSRPMINNSSHHCCRDRAGISFALPSSEQSDRYLTSMHCNGLRQPARTVSGLPRST
jgi:hypothetical protein